MATTEKSKHKRACINCLFGEIIEVENSYEQIECEQIKKQLSVSLSEVAGSVDITSEVDFWPEPDFVCRQWQSK